jgi:uncharacterized RDD family membrane protein YckC
MVTEHNPYAPPAAAVSEAPAASHEREQEPAPRWRRFANLLIDSLCYYALAMLIGIVIALVDASFFDHMSAAGEYAFGFGVMVLYYLPSETLFGRTLGKLVTRTRVPFEPFSFLRARSVGLHDRWSETRVVSSHSE